MAWDCGIGFTEKICLGAPILCSKDVGRSFFVHGCFWHQHSRCIDGKKPKSNAAYWNQKLTGNIKRDRRHRAALKRLGWKVVVVWECETASKELLQSLLRKRLGLPLEARGEALSFSKAPPSFHRE